MRILFVTAHPPSRVRVRSYGFLTQLQREHDITVATQCVSERERANVEALRGQGYRVEVVETSRRQAVLRSGIALFRSLPLQVAYAQSADFARLVQNLCMQEPFDVVHVEHLRGIASVREIVRTHPLVWDAVDCISLLCEQAVTAGPSLPVRAVAFIEYRRTQRFEANLLHQLPHVLITSEHDRQAMNEVYQRYMGGLAHGNGHPGSGVHIDVIPNGVELDYFHPVEQQRRRCNLVFLGRMSYHANVSTVLNLYRQIMPLIWKHRPEATLTIVGSGPPKAIQRLADDPRVEVTGYVEDIRPYVWQAELMLCPMTYSVGIQNKVLESMAMGTPVVAVSRAAAALNARPGKDLLVAETAQEFADAALLLMNDAQLRATLSQCGRKYVERQHDWSVLKDRLLAVYQRAIASYASEGSTALATVASLAGNPI